jgi:hypothetical protein
MLYREQDAKVYTRVSDIIINNPHEGSGLPPSIRFNEEYALIDADGNVFPQGPCNFCGCEFTPDTAATSFDLVNTETGETIGSATYEDLRVMLFSLYFHAAQHRDANPPNDPPVDLGTGVELPPQD